MVHDEVAGIKFFQSRPALEGARTAVDLKIDHLSAIKAVVADIDGVLAGICSVVGEGDLGFSIREFQGLTA